MDIQWAPLATSGFAALAAGLCAVVGGLDLARHRAKSRLPAMTVGIAALVIAILCMAIQLGHPERFFGGFTNLRSGMTRELIALVAAGVITITYLVTLRRRRTIPPGLSRLCLLGGIVLAMAITDNERRPWASTADTLVLLLTHLGAAGVLGTLVAGLLGEVFGDDSEAVLALRQAALAALGLQAVAVLAYVVDLGFAAGGPTRSLSRWLSGDLAPAFWGLVIAAGVLVPVWLSLRPRSSPHGASVARAGVAVACAAAGAIAFRALIAAMAIRAFHF